MEENMTTTWPKFISANEKGLWMTEDERENLKLDYRIKEIIFEAQSKLQHVMILDSYSFGRMLVLDGVVQTTSLDGHIYNEMIAHVPLSIHQNPKKVLVIGGGDCGVAREVCKHSCVERVEVVEIDQMVVEACLKHLPEVSGGSVDSRVNFIFEDGVKYVENTPNQYDVIIVDSSDPVGPAEVLIEQSFYQSVFNALREDGLMVCQSQSPIFHGEIMEQIYGRVQAIFPHTRMFTTVVPTYPGGLWTFTLGSKAYVEPRLDQWEEKDTRYVNKEMIESCFSLPEFLKKQLVKYERK